MAEQSLLLYSAEDHGRRITLSLLGFLGGRHHITDLSSPNRYTRAEPSPLTFVVHYYSSIHNDGPSFPLWVLTISLWSCCDSCWIPCHSSSGIAITVACANLQHCTGCGVCSTWHACLSKILSYFLLLFQKTRTDPIASNLWHSGIKSRITLKLTHFSIILW